MPHQSPPQSIAAPPLPPVTVPRLPAQPRQHRRGLLLLGLLVMAGGGVLASHAVTTLSDRSQVIVLTRDVPVGQQITGNDVAAIMVGSESRVATIPGQELQHVIGKRATVELLAGALLHRRAITDRLSPIGDQQLVPVAVKPSRLPARGFRPGDRLLVIPTAESETVPTARKPTVPDILAIVDQVKEPDDDGLVVVDLLVASADGPRLAALAGDGHVALVLTPRRP